MGTSESIDKGSSVLIMNGMATTKLEAIREGCFKIVQ